MLTETAKLGKSILNTAEMLSCSRETVFQMYLYRDFSQRCRGNTSFTFTGQ